MSLTDLVTRNDTGLTRDGITEAVSRYCEFEATLQGPRVRSKRAVEQIVERLMIRGPATTKELLMYFPADGVHKPDQGRYGEHSGQQWFAGVAEPNLRELPFIKSKRGMWAFSGVDSSEYDDDHTRSLDELRDDPQLQAEQTLDDLGVGRESDEREYLLSFYDELRRQETATKDILDRVTHRVSFSELEDTFQELPGVEREASEPPAPEDIEIDTYADVLEAEETVSQTPTVEWHYHA